MQHLHIIFIHQCLCKATKLMKDVRGYNASIKNKFVDFCSVNTGHVVCIYLKMRFEVYNVKSTRWCAVSFWQKQMRFHSFTMSVNSLHRILSKQKSVYSKKVRSLGSNMPCSKKMIFNNQVYLQEILQDSIHLFAGEDIIERKCNVSPASSLRLLRYMFMSSVSECSVPSSVFIVLTLV